MHTVRHAREFSERKACSARMNFESLCHVLIAQCPLLFWKVDHNGVCEVPIEVFCLDHVAKKSTSMGKLN